MALPKKLFIAYDAEGEIVDWSIGDLSGFADDIEKHYVGQYDLKDEGTVTRKVTFKSRGN